MNREIEQSEKLNAISSRPLATKATFYILKYYILDCIYLVYIIFSMTFNCLEISSLILFD